jgi:hypothetical protein
VRERRTASLRRCGETFAHSRGDGRNRASPCGERCAEGDACPTRSANRSGPRGFPGVEARGVSTPMPLAQARGHNNEKEE